MPGMTESRFRVLRTRDGGCASGDLLRRDPGFAESKMADPDAVRDWKAEHSGIPEFGMTEPKFRTLRTGECCGRASGGV